jgi:hypothetical protein
LGFRVFRFTISESIVWGSVQLRNVSSLEFGGKGLKIWGWGRGFKAKGLRLKVKSCGSMVERRSQDLGS